MIRLFPHLLLPAVALFAVFGGGELRAQIPGSEGGASDYSKAIAQRALEPWEKFELDFDTGVLWKLDTDSTPLDYTVLPQVISFKTPALYHWDFGTGDLVLRSRINLLGEYFLKGPESYFFGFSGSPSIEWWNAERSFQLFFSVGGGVGFLDSRGQEVEGAQGQDFNFNWFAHAGARHRIGENFLFQYGAFFQHISNRGLDDINPGLDALGPMVGFSWEW